jgi:hypothetical protein
MSDGCGWMRSRGFALTRRDRLAAATEIDDD